MSHQNSVYKVLFFMLLLTCLIWMGVWGYVPKAKQMMPTHPQNENLTLLSLQQKYEHHLEGRILKLLEPLAGKGKVQAVVQIQLDLKNAHLTSTTRKFKRQDPFFPDKAETIARSDEKQIQNMIQNQHISIIVDGNTRKGDKGIYQPRTSQEMNAYKRLIQSAVGYNPERGDTLEIQNIPFTFQVKQERRHPTNWTSVLLTLLGCLLIGWSLIPGIDTKAEQENTPFASNLLDQITQNPSRAITVLKNWIYMPENTKNSDWTPLQKVGITLLSLDEKMVRQILIALEDNEVRQVAKTMTTLGVIPPQESARILTELYEAMTKGSAVVGNPTRVRQILSESTNEQTLKFKETLQTPNASLWQELTALKSSELAERLTPIKPEIIAYILYRLPTEKASALVQCLPENKATQVLIHLSHIGHINPTAQAKMEQEALNITQDILNTIHTPTGTEKASEILSKLSDTQTGHNVLKDLNEQEPSLAHTLAIKLSQFNDIAVWTDQNIQTLLRNIPRAKAILALTYASENVKQAVLKNIPNSMRYQLEQDILKERRQSSKAQSHVAQQEITQTIKTLLQQGKIQV